MSESGTGIICASTQAGSEKRRAEKEKPRRSQVRDGGAGTEKRPKMGER
jgi:hypothetical protein